MRELKKVFELKGTVVDEATGKPPLNQACIAFEDVSSSDYDDTKWTDRNGQWNIYLPQGTYKIHYACDGLNGIREGIYPEPVIVGKDNPNDPLMLKLKPELPK